LANDPLGRLTGIDRPLEGPLLLSDPAAIRLDVTLDAVALARGIHSATGATLEQIMAD
jgi:hypothetical protein